MNVDVINPKPDTIYEALKHKLGRDPSYDEMVAEVKRILIAAAVPPVPAVLD